MSEFNKHFDKLYNEVKDFVFFKNFIRKDMPKDSEIVGINAAASSLIRKSFTLDRVENVIKSERLPLELIDDIPHTRYFKVLLKGNLPCQKV